MSQYSTDQFRTSCGALAPLELNVSGPGWAGDERRVFEQPFALVGRDERSCLRLEDAAVSRRHVYLQQLQGRVFCLDLGSRTGIRWGRETRPAGWLDLDAGIQIGPFSLAIRTAAGAGVGPGDEVRQDRDPLQDRLDDSQPLPHITIEVGNEVLSQLRMNRLLLLVGNSPACRVRLRDTSVSKFHCSLVSTPEGVWIVDLLSGTGTRLNGQPVRSALVNEGDRLQVGPYVLRVWYQDVPKETPPSGISEISTAPPVQTADVLPESVWPESQEIRVLPEQPGSALAQPVAMPREEQTAAEASGLLPSLRADLDQIRERLRGAELSRQELADSQAECVQLRELVRALENQVTEKAALQAQLEAAEASAHELDVIRAERDRWQIEAQDLQSGITANSAEREELRQRLEEAQQQLSGEREAVRKTGERLDQASATLQEVSANFAARNADYAVALQRLQETQDELARSQDEARDLQSELDRTRECQRDSEALRQQLADAQAKHDQLWARVPELEDRATTAEVLCAQLRDGQTETERLRVELRTAESRVAELEAVRAECVRLREEALALETQVAEVAALRAQLEAAKASERDLYVIRAERDRWQIEVQDLQNRITADSGEREEWQQRLNKAQQELIAEREAVRALGVRLDQESATLQEVRADFAARNAEHAVASRRLQETQDELARSQDEVRGLQAELDQTRERLPEAEVIRQQLADSQAECDRLGEEARALEIQVAELAALQAQLEAARANASELDVVRAERDHWQTEAQDLLNRIASDSTVREQLERLAADLHAAQAEGERLHIEQQSSLHSAEQASARLSDLERVLADATAAHESVLAEARASWESERQALELRLEQERQIHNGASQSPVRDAQIKAEAAIRDIQVRAAAEREEWRQRLEGAEAQIVWERGLFQEQSQQIRQQAAILQAERDRLAARLAQAESSLRAVQEPSRDDAGHAAQPEHLHQLNLRDQVFAEICSIQVGHPLGQAARAPGQERPAEKGRPRAYLESEWTPDGGQHRLSAIEQGVEAAWEQAAAGQKRLATSHNMPNRAEKPMAEVGPEAEAKDTVERQAATDTPPSIQSESGAASVPCDTQQATATLLEDGQSGDEVHGWHSARKVEERQGLLRKIFNFVVGK